MPSSVVQTFSDADDYVAAIRQGTVEVTVTGRGNFAAKLTKIDLHRLWMQRFSENLARIYHVAVSPASTSPYSQNLPPPRFIAQPNRVVIYLPKSDSPSIYPIANIPPASGLCRRAVVAREV